MNILAIVALSLLVGLIVFQIAAVCGAKVGRFTQGGKSAECELREW